MNKARQGAFLARLAGLSVVRGVVQVPIGTDTVVTPVAEAVDSAAVVNRAIAALDLDRYAEFLVILEDIGGWGHRTAHPTFSELLASSPCVKAEAVLRAVHEWEEEEEEEEGEAYAYVSVERKRYLELLRMERQLAELCGAIAGVLEGDR